MEEVFCQIIYFPKTMDRPTDHTRDVGVVSGWGGASTTRRDGDLLSAAVQIDHFGSEQEQVGQFSQGQTPNGCDLAHFDSDHHRDVSVQPSLD
jgi:hypothetical protein